MERQDINQYKDIWVFAEQRQGKITPVVIELLGEGRKLADTKGIKLNAILLGKDVNGLAEELIMLLMTHCWKISQRTDTQR